MVEHGSEEPGDYILDDTDQHLERPAGNGVRPGRDHGPITIAQRTALPMTAG